MGGFLGGLPPNSAGFQKDDRCEVPVMSSDLLASLLDCHQNFQIATGRDPKEGRPKFWELTRARLQPPAPQLNYAIREFVGRAADSGPAAKSGA